MAIISGTVNPYEPTRLLDTRTLSVPLTALEVRTIYVPQAADVAQGWFANITVVNPTADGYLTLWGAGHPQPTTSNVNFVAGQTVANMALMMLADDGLGNGPGVQVFNGSTGTVDVIIDLVGLIYGHL